MLTRHLSNVCPASNPKRASSNRCTRPHPTISLLEMCSTMDELRQIHAILIKSGYIQHNLALSKLLLFAALSKSGSLEYAQKAFDGIPQPNTFFCNTMIRGYRHGGNPTAAFLLYSKMVDNSTPPDKFTFPFVLSSLSDISQGKQVHAHILKSSLPFTVHTQNCLLHFYVKHGLVEDAHQVFVGIDVPDIVSWNTLIDGYVKIGNLRIALCLFNEMPQRDVVSWTTMLVGCIKHGLWENAHALLESMPEKNVVSWSAIIDGYVQLGRFKEALDIFQAMQSSKILPDKVTMTSVLSACGRMGALDQGRWIHAYIDKNGIELDAHLATSLVDMYCRCGSLNDALKTFRDANDKQVFLWNALLGGLAMHSRALDAIQTFLEMLEAGICPNEITFICILLACSHAGLVDHGLQIFDDMTIIHKITPRVEHYVCMVDLLGRAGLLDRAKQLIETMPIPPDANTLRSLLNACVIHRNFEIGESIGKMLIKMEPDYDGNYVLLSNIYAAAVRWADVAAVRMKMKMKGVMKQPGWSLIELDGVVHQFFAGDRSHSQSKEICTILDDLSSKLLLTENDQLTMKLIYEESAEF